MRVNNLARVYLTGYIIESARTTKISNNHKKVTIFGGVYKNIFNNNQLYI